MCPISRIFDPSQEGYLLIPAFRIQSWSRSAGGARSRRQDLSEWVPCGNLGGRKASGTPDGSPEAEE